MSTRFGIVLLLERQQGGKWYIRSWIYRLHRGQIPRSVTEGYSALYTSRFVGVGIDYQSYQLLARAIWNGRVSAVLNQATGCHRKRPKTGEVRND